MNLKKRIGSSVISLIFTVSLCLLSSIPSWAGDFKDLPVYFMFKWYGVLEQVPKTYKGGSGDVTKDLWVMNRMVNSVPYVEDAVNYNTFDYWATPDEFVVNGGDCEDYAIMKYFLVEQMYPQLNPMIYVVFDKKVSDYHAFLTVTINGTELVLDNNTDTVYPLRWSTKFKTVYKLNRKGWYVPNDTK